MQVKLSALFSKKALPGWAFVIWRIIETLGDVQFVVEVSGWVRTHMGEEIAWVRDWGWLFGLAWLGLLVYRGGNKTEPIRDSGIAESSDEASIQERVSALESHTDISGAEGRLINVLVEGRLNSALTIHSACYGLGKEKHRSVDVKAVLESYIKFGSIDIVVTNETMKCGNIFSGDKKILFVEYSSDRHAHKCIEARESHKLVIPES